MGSTVKCLTFEHFKDLMKSDVVNEKNLMKTKLKSDASVEAALMIMSFDHSQGPALHYGFLSFDGKGPSENTPNKIYEWVLSGIEGEQTWGFNDSFHIFQYLETLKSYEGVIFITYPDELCVGMLYSKENKNASALRGDLWIYNAPETSYDGLKYDIFKKVNKLAEIKKSLLKSGIDETTAEAFVMVLGGINFNEHENGPFIRIVLIPFETGYEPTSRSLKGIAEWLKEYYDDSEKLEFKDMGNLFLHLGTLEVFDGLIYVMYPNDAGVSMVYTKYLYGKVETSGLYLYGHLNSEGKLNESILRDINIDLDNYKNDESLVERAAEYIKFAEGLEDKLLKCTLYQFKNIGFPLSKTKEGIVTWIQEHPNMKGQEFSSLGDVFKFLALFEEYDVLIWQEYENGTDTILLLEKTLDGKFIDIGPWRLGLKNNNNLPLFLN